MAENYRLYSFCGEKYTTRKRPNLFIVHSFSTFRSLPPITV